MPNQQTHTMVYPKVYMVPGWVDVYTAAMAEASLNVAAVTAVFTANQVPVCSCTLGGLDADKAVLIGSDTKVTLFASINTSTLTPDVPVILMQGRVTGTAFSRTSTMQGVMVQVSGVVGDLQMSDAYTSALSGAGRALSSAMLIQPGLVTTLFSKDLVFTAGVLTMFRALVASLTDVDKINAKAVGGTHMVNVLLALTPSSGGVNPTGVVYTPTEAMAKLTGDLRMPGTPSLEFVTQGMSAALASLFYGPQAGTSVWDKLLAFGSVLLFDVAPTATGAEIRPAGTLCSKGLSTAISLTELFDYKVKDVGMYSGVRGVLLSTPGGTNTTPIMCGAMLNRPGSLVNLPMPKFLKEKGITLVPSALVYDSVNATPEVITPLPQYDTLNSVSKATPSPAMGKPTKLPDVKTYTVVSAGVADNLVAAASSGATGVSATTDIDIAATFAKYTLGKVLYGSRRMTASGKLRFDLRVGQGVRLTSQEGTVVVMGTIQSLQHTISAVGSKASTDITLNNVRSATEESEIAGIFTGHPFFGTEGVSLAVVDEARTAAAVATELI